MLGRRSSPGRQAGVLPVSVMTDSDKAQRGAAASPGRLFSNLSSSYKHEPGTVAGAIALVAGVLQRLLLGW